jgi:hypothetical protein
MHKAILATLAATVTLPLSAGSAAAAGFEIYKDYTPSTEVWNVTFVKVVPSKFDDYLEGLKQTWWSGCEIGKKNGTVLECAIYASEEFTNRDFNVMLVIKAPNAAASDPNEKRYHDFIAETRKMLAEDKEKKMVEGYEQMRSFFGEQNFRRITFK